MADQRRKNVSWKVAAIDGCVPTWERASIAVLMDIRDELQTLNGLLSCQHFMAIPRTLKQIRANTAKPRKVRR